MLFNAPILVLAKVIKNVVSSVAEAETAAVFMNEEEVVAIYSACLAEICHKRPPTWLKTDNGTTNRILTLPIKQKCSNASYTRNVTSCTTERHKDTLKFIGMQASMTLLTTALSSIVLLIISDAWLYPYMSV